MNNYEQEWYEMFDACERVMHDTEDEEYTQRFVDGLIRAVTVRHANPVTSLEVMAHRIDRFVEACASMKGKLAEMSASEFMYEIRQLMMDGAEIAPSTWPSD